MDDGAAEEVAGLVARTAEAASAIIRGDIRRYVELIRHADDFTLMRPDGGETVRGFDSSPERLEEMSRFFTGGEARLELEKSYASGDLVVLVLVERQHGVVGGQPDQDLSLRVTLVWRRDGADWQLVHRHADPLVRGIAPDQLSALLRG